MMRERNLLLAALISAIIAATAMLGEYGEAHAQKPKR